MQFLKNTVKDIQTKFNINKCVAEATSPSKLSVKYEDADPVILLAREHPHLVVQAISDRLVYDGYVSTTTFLSIQLLEAVVNSSSYTLHTVLADHKVLRHQIVDFACISGDNNTCRAVKGAAKKLVLEFSRMFADDDRLILLARLAETVERRSGKDLLRSIMLEGSRVHIRSPKEGDFIPISPIKRAKGSSGPRFPPAPWACPGCQFTNKAKQLRCVVCNGPKPKKKPMPQLELNTEAAEIVGRGGGGSPRGGAAAASRVVAPSSPQPVLQGSIVHTSAVAAPDQADNDLPATPVAIATPATSATILEGSVVAPCDASTTTAVTTSSIVVSSSSVAIATPLPIEEEKKVEEEEEAPGSPTIENAPVDDATDDFITEHKVADQVKAALHDNAAEEEARMERQRLAEEEAEAERKLKMAEEKEEEEMSDASNSDEPEAETEEAQPEPEVETKEAQPEPEAETEEAQPEPEVETEEAQPEPEVETEEAQPEPEVETEEAQPEPEVETEEAQPEPEVETEEAQPEPEAETKEAQPEPEAETEEAQPEPEAETEEAHPEPEAETEEAQPEPEVETKVPDALAAIEISSPIAPSPEEFDEAVSEEEEVATPVTATAAIHVDPATGVDSNDNVQPNICEEEE